MREIVLRIHGDELRWGEGKGFVGKPMDIEVSLDVKEFSMNQLGLIFSALAAKFAVTICDVNVTDLEKSNASKKPGAA